MPQYIESISSIIEENNTIENQTIEKKNKIPEEIKEFPLEGNNWLKIEDIVCVFIDMKDSTLLSIGISDKEMAKKYRFFTSTAIDVLNIFQSSYMDIKGDGVFGLFERNRIYHALCSAVTFKTIISNEPNFNGINCHIGMDISNVLTRRLGLRRSGDKTLKQNEVWAGETVNTASKLASLGGNNELLISQKIYDIFKNDKHEEVLRSCGCEYDDRGNLKRNNLGKLNIGSKGSNWKERVDLLSPMQKIHQLTSRGWCNYHGEEYCKIIKGKDSVSN